MKNKSQPLRNDQNNHLSNQIMNFEKGLTRSQNSSPLSVTAKSYATQNHDNVTATFIRGYN
ncbi:MAG: hypothetical protein HRU23_18760 [Gammaproteobacteria bacterium]|nr:hypothetical protein [Gammaproteobacteria bacterium]